MWLLLSGDSLVIDSDKRNLVTVIQCDRCYVTPNLSFGGLRFTQKKRPQRSKTWTIVGRYSGIEETERKRERFQRDE